MKIQATGRCPQAQTKTVQTKADAFKLEDLKRGSLQDRQILDCSHSTTSKHSRKHTHETNENNGPIPHASKSQERSLDFNPCLAVMECFHLPTGMVSENAMSNRFLSPPGKNEARFLSPLGWCWDEVREGPVESQDLDHHTAVTRSYSTSMVSMKTMWGAVTRHPELSQLGGSVDTLWGARTVMPTQ